MLQNGARMDEQDLVMKGVLEKRIGIQKDTVACAERDTVSISSGYERYIILQWNLFIADMLYSRHPYVEDTLV